jgi:hypothetical protein
MELKGQPVELHVLAGEPANPFNGIERKGSGLEGRLAGNPFNGIERDYVFGVLEQLKGKILGIHSMELKGAPPPVGGDQSLKANPFNGIERS